MDAARDHRKLPLGRSRPGRPRVSPAIAGSLLAALIAVAVPAHGDAPAPGPAGAAAKSTKKKRARNERPAPPPPLDGVSHDFEYDGLDVGHAERAYQGRVFVHRLAAAVPAGEALPILIFLHGTNAEKIRYRWMGGGQEGDVRRIVSELIEAGQIPPMLIAGPSSINPSTIVNAMTSWPAFDTDTFLDKAAAKLAGVATIDRTRVVVAGHSGGGCNIRGGLATASKAKTPVLGAMSIDTCMGTDLAKLLAHAGPTHVIVSWQTMSWDSRPFTDFRTVFRREIKKTPPPAGALRELAYEAPTIPMAHDAMVGVTLTKWLPKLLPLAGAGVGAKAQAGDGGAALSR